MPIYFYSVDSKAPFMIESIGYDWLQEPIVRSDGHPYYHWLQTTSGTGLIQIGKIEKQLKPGQGVLIPPFIPHSYQSLDQKDWQTNFLTIAGKFTIYLSEILGNQDFYLMEDYPEFHFSNWLKETTDELQQPYNRTANELAAYSFFMQVRTYLNREQTPHHPLFENYVHPLLEWIDTHFDQTLTLSEAANQIYLSPQYINRLFNRFLGISFQQYVLQVRIRKAKERLIQYPQLKVFEIAEQVGYQDTSYFIANFKKECGMTPEQFRQLY